jgi:hypothetical protein
MDYFELICETCDETFKPFLGDRPGELLHPHGFDDHELCRGRDCDCRNQDTAVAAVRAFHQNHAGHSLAERIYQRGEQPCAQQEKQPCSPTTR